MRSRQGLPRSKKAILLLIGLQHGGLIDAELPAARATVEWQKSNASINADLQPRKPLEQSSAVEVSGRGGTGGILDAFDK